MLATSQLQWWKPGARRFHQRQQMMVAAVDAVHEGDQVGGAVGQAQAQLALVEIDRGVDVGGEGQHMRQPARPHRRRFLARMAAPAVPAGAGVHWLSDFLSGDTFGATFTSISTFS